MVWAAPAKLFGKNLGYLPFPAEDVLKTWLEKSVWLSRPQAEIDPSFRQWIPYVTLKRNDKVFCLRRTTGGGEVRLHERMTVGLGGHVNPIDEAAKEGAILGALWRELMEEAELGPEHGELETGGMVILSDNDVSKVHVGLHFWFHLNQGVKVKLSADGGKDGRWVTPKDLSADEPRLETWSNTVLKAVGWGA